MATYVGLLLELFLLAAGLYLYLFARGRVSFGTPEQRARAEVFRADNKGWLRLLGLALAAVMAVNVVLHVMELL